MKISSSLHFFRSMLRRTPIYYFWRKFREYQQIKAFHELLDRICPRVSIDFINYEESIRNRLQKSANWRREINTPGARISVAAFGTNDWEQYGLWPSFKRKSHFCLFDYKEWIRLNGYKRASPEVRSKLSNAFKKFIDGADSKSKVNIAFFYADSKFIHPDILSWLHERGIWTVLMGLDDKHRFRSRSQFGMSLGQELLATDFDIVWTTWKTGLLLYQMIGANAWYAPEAADPEYFHPMDNNRDIKIVFVGQAYGPRLNLIRYLNRRGFDVQCFGSGWQNGFVSHNEMVNLYSRAKVVLGVGHVQSMAWVQHLKGRDFEVPMCGAVYLTSYNHELADHFEIGSEILCYSSFTECAEMLHWLLSNEAFTDSIRSAALERSLRSHTWDKRIQQLISLFPLR